MHRSLTAILLAALAQPGKIVQKLSPDAVTSFVAALD